MTGAQAAASLAAAVYGLFLCQRRKQPLFFKILLYGLISYFFGAVFTAAYALVYGAAPAGFHVGYFGHIGMYFFLLSSYYGAMDRLADGGERAYLRYRLLALAAPLCLLAYTGLSVGRMGAAAGLPLIILALPMVLTLYFALKHLIFPDVDMGIIRVMRPYNACVILFCLAEAAALGPLASPETARFFRGLSCLLLLLLLPAAEMGVRKWYI